MYELFMTIGRKTYSYGLFDFEFIEMAKEDLKKNTPTGKVFAVEREVNVLRLESDKVEVIEYFN